MGFHPAFGAINKAIPFIWPGKTTLIWGDVEPSPPFPLLSTCALQTGAGAGGMLQGQGFFFLSLSKLGQRGLFWEQNKVLETGKTGY